MRFTIRCRTLTVVPADLSDCPIQQGLADENPDVDAIYRLILPLPVRFRDDRTLALGRAVGVLLTAKTRPGGPSVFPLLYLPAYCSFRMTDIWRSFVSATNCMGKWVVYSVFEGDCWQERNDHKLMADFADEVPGYLNNRLIGEALDSLTITAGTSHPR